MCGGGPTTTTTNNTTTTGSIPKYLQDASKDLIKSAKLFQTQYGADTPDETLAYSGIRGNADQAFGFMPQQADLINMLYGGGGLGEAMPALRSAYGQASSAYQPYLQSNYLNPMSNPYLQPSIDAARSGAFNDVSQRFSKAGRSFSGAESGAFGDAAAKAALPLLLGQYNQNVGAQQAAAQGLLGGAMGFSGALDESQQARLKAMMAAPGQIGNLNIPQQMLLGIADRQRNAAQVGLSGRVSAVNQTPFVPSSTGSGTTTASTASDPFQTLIGGGLGLLGALF